MENNINTFVPDITFMSELILDTNTTTVNLNLTCQGLIRTNNLRCTSSFVTLFLRTILNEVKDIVLP